MLRLGLNMLARPRPMPLAASKSSPPGCRFSRLFSVLSPTEGSSTDGPGSPEPYVNTTNVHNVVMCAHARLGNHEGASSVLKNMKESNIPGVNPDNMTYTMLLVSRVYGDQKLKRACSEIFKEWEGAHIPGVFSMSPQAALATICAHGLECGHRAEDITGAVEAAQGFVEPEVLWFHSSVLIRDLVARQRLPEALHVFWFAESVGPVALPTKETLHELISACLQDNKLLAAHELFEVLTAAPDFAAEDIVELCRAAIGAGQPGIVHAVFPDGVVWEEETVEAIAMLAREGKEYARLAARVYQDAVRAGTATAVALEAVIRAHEQHVLPLGFEP